MSSGVAAVVVAAGRGTRAGLDYPKQYKVMGGRPMVRASLRAFAEHPLIDLVVPVILPDDAALVEWAGLRVTVFDGEQGNIKMTTPEDFARIEREAQIGLGDVRTGIGYDIHAFDDGGDHVWLGGVKIPNGRKLQGHSDA